MEWEFTPDEVVRGDVDYGLEQFRNDLWQEVRQNTGDMEVLQQRKIFDAMYDLCYWVATGNDFDDFLATLNQESFFPGFFSSIREHLEVNITMLGAILQRMIMDRVEGQGMPLEAALKEVDALHRQIVAQPLLH